MNTIVERTGDYISGMHVIERATAACFVGNGIELHVRDLQWNEGKPFVPAPSHTCLEIRAPGAPYFRLDFSREEIEDCWERVDRLDVQTKLDNVEATIRSMKGTKT